MTCSIEATIFEEHAEVLAHWIGRGVKEAVVVCFDAHLDVQYISDQRLARLRQCRTSSDVLARMKPHHLMPDRNNATSAELSFGIEDFLFAASRLGVIRRLVWVAPAHIPIFDMEVATDQLRQSEGVTVEDLASLKVCGEPAGAVRWIRGSLLGIDLTVCHREALPFLELPSETLVDIDIDYFVELPSEQIGVSPADVVNDLVNLPLDLTEVTISRSVESGFTPLRFRQIAEELASCFRGLTLDDVNQTSRVNASSVCRESQRDDLLRRACEYPARGLEIDGQQIIQLHSELASFEPLDQKRGLIEAALGILWCHVGDIDAAARCYQTAVEVFGGHPELALELARGCMEMRRFGEARGYLLDALHDDKTRASAHFYLGQLAIEFARSSGDGGFVEEAITHLQNARDRTPAWEPVVESLVHVHCLRGDHVAADRYRACLAEITDAKVGNVDPSVTDGRMFGVIGEWFE
ncbi:tetratricopeptide (TPR) repeat protein [Rhodopirellula rubra]|uniref:Tetratricopeptide (TPR) repeat protein n=1 Tax=Aporhodopirellula rubra TaxID=980271 RepID=A0A7W5E1D2_9BACT|nr:hypothetical protein [Aporhodopirellula rubra]MBB3208394.1 tetratricopeptide (TPR) repeat protein [Aporhodopirellula rubra]